ncbi:MAG TPA: hypothetical protein VL463_26520 [Kofleriaceae bacterium]|nr:hypothetical protein [Kofleriaceae bacterium]
MYVVAFAGIAASTAVLAPATPEPAAAPAIELDHDVHVRGRGASTGHVTDFTLHAAHLGASPAISCNECHAIRADGFAKPDRDRCLACHPERDLALHKSVADADARECTSCHDFLDARTTAEAAWGCGRCHPRPHGDPTLLAKDPSETCGRCHSPHGEKAAKPPTCTGCHDDHATRHHADDDPATGACLACHGRHDPAVNARARCAPCHRDREPKIPATATFANGHECTGCHAPHKFAKDEVRACTGCHGEHRALASSRVPEHARCQSCHDPHAPKTAADRCTSCHADVHPEHPTNCIGCHPPHTGVDTAGVPVQACSTCHTKAHDDRAFHRGARCVDCHQQHAFKRTFGTTFCLGCHARRVGAKPAIAPSTGHSDCGNCHQRNPHDPAQPPACATCHAEQASTVPQGHAQCSRCHEIHSGALKPNVATCIGCHADRKRGPHVSQPCEKCHRPHAPGANAKPPSCATCHDRSQLHGMHAVNGHATCTSCHQPHGETFPDRATCLGCHADRKDHEPQAALCTGCHTFGDAP